ncbi:MAG: Rpn family recombination-promoting nuclease/putative transposase [Treponema sp.]|jgi:predicted transposase/invertase (TIGR01784 family)|nr:Rpn family recombination-promoting nuclease/putative transposase [Treponema sp.]
MGEKGDEEQLPGFLNAVLRRTRKTAIVSVEIIENKTFNIEVQLRNYGNMDKRSLFYWSREYTRSLDQGQDYNELPSVVAINIVNFEFCRPGNFRRPFIYGKIMRKD